jgi:hypothetical protein
MSSELEFLETQIRFAELGNDGALRLLRRIVSKSGEVAPKADLLKIAGLLRDIRRQALRESIERN